MARKISEMNKKSYFSYNNLFQIMQLDKFRNLNRVILLVEIGSHCRKPELF